MLKTIRRRCFRSLIQSESIQSLFRRGIAIEQARRNFAGAYEFEDRTSGARRAILIVAGYKPWLWEDTLQRIFRFAPQGSDVCVVSPGIRSDRLRQMCASHGWSLLVTSENRLALGQNLAISRLSNAELIHKLDEDIFVSEGYFTGLEKGLARIRGLDVCNPGMTVPVINVNGYSYRTFLEVSGATEGYRSVFGELRVSCMDVKAWSDGAAALWLWKQSLPFDKMAAHFGSKDFTYSLVPHRFSIGAILIEREMWDRVGGFLVGPGGQLGHEEEHICIQCMALSRPITCVHTVLAGHFAFGPQEVFMRKHIAELRMLDSTLVLENSGGSLRHA